MADRRRRDAEEGGRESGSSVFGGTVIVRFRSDDEFVCVYVCFRIFRVGMEMIG